MANKERLVDVADDYPMHEAVCDVIGVVIGRYAKRALRTDDDVLVKRLTRLIRECVEERRFLSELSVVELDNVMSRYTALYRVLYAEDETTASAKEAEVPEEEQ